MTKRARHLVALGAAVIGFLIVATYRPFGGTDPIADIKLPDPKASGYETGLECGSRLAMEDAQRFKTPERIAQYIAIRSGLAKEQRETWCAEFVKGFEVGMRERR